MGVALARDNDVEAAKAKAVRASNTIEVKL
jgi:formate-dependent phosphoribosylglycinamide formyltransferase (GAR transformylase)